MARFPFPWSLANHCSCWLIVGWPVSTGSTADDIQRV
jgi:hypothetical protein